MPNTSHTNVAEILHQVHVYTNLHIPLKLHDHIHNIKQCVMSMQTGGWQEPREIYWCNLYTTEQSMAFWDCVDHFDQQKGRGMPDMYLL